MSESCLTAGEMVAAVRDRWATVRTDTEIFSLLRTCENTIRTQILGLEALDSLAPDAPLCVFSPYEELYLHYIAAHLAQLDGETARYNEELALFYARWNDYITAHRRATLPPDRCAVGFANKGVHP